MDPTKPQLPLWLLCAISIVIGCAAYWAFWIENDTNPKVPFFAALIGGFGSAWLINKGYQLLRRRQHLVLGARAQQGGGQPSV